MLCEDKGGNQITVSLTDFISMAEAAAVERLQRVMVSGNDGALSPVHWSCNIPPRISLAVRAIALKKKKKEEEVMLVVNLTHHYSIHIKTLCYWMSAQSNNVLV